MNGLSLILYYNWLFPPISDYDECSDGSHSCPPDGAVCVNTPGSYLCLACPFGVDKDGNCTS